MPLRVRERHLGSLVACTTTSGRTFDADQIELCQGIARQLAVAIESVDLYCQQQEEAEVATTFARVGQAMIASLNTPTMSDQLCQLTAEALNGHCNCTFLWQAETEAYKPVASWGALSGTASTSERSFLTAGSCQRSSNSSPKS